VVLNIVNIALRFSVSSIILLSLFSSMPRKYVGQQGKNRNFFVAGPRGFEPLVFGFLPRFARPEADALIRAGQRARFLL
jgi:hypothetical protein